MDGGQANERVKENGEGSLGREGSDGEDRRRTCRMWCSDAMFNFAVAGAIICIDEIHRPTIDASRQTNEVKSAN